MTTFFPVVPYATEQSAAHARLRASFALAVIFFSYALATASAVSSDSSSDAYRDLSSGNTSAYVYVLAALTVALVSSALRPKLGSVPDSDKPSRAERRLIVNSTAAGLVLADVHLRVDQEEYAARRARERRAWCVGVGATLTTLCLPAALSLLGVVPVPVAAVTAVSSAVASGYVSWVAVRSARGAQVVKETLLLRHRPGNQPV